MLFSVCVKRELAIIENTLQQNIIRLERKRLVRKIDRLDRKKDRLVRKKDR